MSYSDINEAWLAASPHDAGNAESAMVLTDQEWADLAAMMQHVRRCCLSGACEHHDSPQALRLRSLADRVIAAVAGAELTA